MGRMKYLIFSCLVLLLVPITGTRAQDKPFNQIDPGCCSNFQNGIVSPPANVDFKLIIITPPKIDQAMVVNPCQESRRLSTPPKVSNPDRDKKVEQFFKLPPFPTGKSGQTVLHLWN
jgi:hypothetical protein